MVMKQMCVGVALVLGMASVTSAQATVQVPAAPAELPSLFGVGGRVGGGSGFGVGGSIRGWSSGRVGVQVDVSRSSMGLDDSSFGIRTSVDSSVLEVSPSVLVKLGVPDPKDDLQVLPYAGGGISLFRSSVSASASGFGVSVSDGSSATDVGFGGFGGVELRFRKAPKLGVSADLGFYTSSVPFVGYSVGGFAFGVGAHIYLK